MCRSFHAVIRYPSGVIDDDRQIHTARNSVSRQLQRILGVDSYKGAWFAIHLGQIENLHLRDRIGGHFRVQPCVNPHTAGAGIQRQFQLVQGKQLLLLLQFRLVIFLLLFRRWRGRRGGRRWWWYSDVNFQQQVLWIGAGEFLCERKDQEQQEGNRKPTEQPRREAALVSCFCLKNLPHNLRQIG